MTTTQRSLAAIAEQLTSHGRGILAADESIKTMSQRLVEAGVTASESNRRDYRELLLTTPGLSAHVSGIIMSDETFGQTLSDGRSFPEAAHELGILPGIKVDTGTTPLPDGSGALITEGLDGLADRLSSYAERGAAFAKWRAVIDVTTMTDDSARANARALAAYAAACQAHGIVPIVEPEVLATGAHELAASGAATRTALATLFDELTLAVVDLTGIVLKPNFVTPGLESRQVSPQTVATVTWDVLRKTVPPEVPGVAFLSGGHPTDRACAYLAALNEVPGAPWHLTFSFGRALVNDALTTWQGDPSRKAAAQQALLANCAAAAGSTARVHA